MCERRRLNGISEDAGVCRMVSCVVRVSEVGAVSVEGGRSGWVDVGRLNTVDVGNDRPDLIGLGEAKAAG